MLLPGLVDLVGGWQRWPKAVSSHQKFQNLCCQIPIETHLRKRKWVMLPYDVINEQFWDKLTCHFKTKLGTKLANFVML